MKCYIVMYELRSPGRNYTAFYSALKSYGTWAKITDRSWAIVSDHSPKEIRDHLTQFIDSSDRLFIIKSGHNSAWRNAIGNTEWFKKYLKLI